MLAVLTTVLALYAPQLGLVGVMAAVFTAISTIWLVGVWRMARLLEVGRTELRAFRPVGWIAVSALAAAAVTAVVRTMVIGAPEWQMIAVCAMAFAAVYATGLSLSGVLATAEVRSLFHDLRRAAVGAGAILAALRRRPRPQAPSDSAPAPVDPWRRALAPETTECLEPQLPTANSHSACPAASRI